MNEVLEGDDTLSEYSTVRDPVKIINVYGYGYCAIFAHCVEDTPRPPSPVVITHVWTDRDGRRIQHVERDGPGQYEVEAGLETVDESIEIAVPSVGDATLE